MLFPHLELPEDAREGIVESLYESPVKLLSFALKRLAYNARKLKSKRVSGFKLYMKELSFAATKKPYLVTVSERWNKLSEHEKTDYSEKAKMVKLQLKLHTEEAVPAQRRTETERKWRVKGARLAVNFYMAFELKGRHLQNLKESHELWNSECAEVQQKYKALEALDKSRRNFEREVLGRFEFVLRLLSSVNSHYLSFAKSPFECYRNYMVESLNERELIKPKGINKLARVNYKYLSSSEKSYYKNQQRTSNSEDLASLLSIVTEKANIDFKQLLRNLKEDASSDLSFQEEDFFSLI